MTTATKQKMQLITTPQGVTFTRAMFDALVSFPPLIDRARARAPGLIPMKTISEVARAKELLHDYREWAVEHQGEDVTVSEELWELVKDWRPILERIRTTPGIPFAPIEVDGIVKSRSLWPVME